MFSDLNNLEDISLQQAYNNLCGITEQELLENFEEGIRVLGQHNEMAYEETCKSLRQWYDGYHFPVMQTAFTIRSVCSMP